MTDDITRAEARCRIGSAEALPVHTEMKKVHKKFRERGGIIRILGNPRDLPEIIWSESGKIIRGVKFPPHIRIDMLAGPQRMVKKAETLATIVENPYDDEE